MEDDGQGEIGFGRTKPHLMSGAFVHQMSTVPQGTTALSVLQSTVTKDRSAGVLVARNHCLS